MNILHVVRNLEVGGMERVVLTLAAEQQRQGDTVHVYEVEDCAGERLAKPEGLVVGRVPARLSRFSPRVCLDLIYFIRKHHVDVVHAHNLLALRYAWLPARLMRRRLVFTKHGMSFPAGISRWLCGRPDAVAAVSKPVYERYQDSFPRMAAKLHHIPNGIAPFLLPERAAAREQMKLDANARVLLWVGRCVREKGLDLLLDAFVRTDGKKTILLLVGDGPERAALEAQTERLGIRDNVRFEGMQHDLKPYYAAADVFVLPSRTEGLPMALLEAGIAGLPAIVSDAGEMPAIITGSEGGWVVKLNPPETLRNGLCEIMMVQLDALHAKGEHLKAYINRNYSIQKQAEQYTGIYMPLGKMGGQCA